MYNHILSIIFFTPLVGALVLLFVPKENKDAIRWIANFFALGGFAGLAAAGAVVLGAALRARLQVRRGRAQQLDSLDRRGLRPRHRRHFVPADHADHAAGRISILSSWTAIENRVKEYYIWFLVLQTGMLGVFMALDFFLFFVFWEAMLVPMYLLIGIWGGPRKLYAAIKFFLYTLAGSVLMLLGILFLYFHHHT
jgi:NADH-quinone oxidoreductase subunit M